MEKSEDALVAWIAARHAAAGVPIGIGDDMAMLPGGLLLTADMLMDGVDFDAGRHTPEQIGRKALAVSLSDCAAMAVRPRWAMVSVALPGAWSMEQARGLLMGMEPLARQFDVRIVGGDTNSWNAPLVIDVIVAAEPWPGVAPVRRAGMRPGDALWVTGRLGGTLAGRHLTFDPRVHEARALAERLGSSLHAMIDLSDGLSTDAHRLARASGGGIVLDGPALDRVISGDAREASRADGRSPLEHALDDGEDFELLFAAAGDPAAEGGMVAALGGRLACARIGRAVSEPGLWLEGPGGVARPVEARGWQHFTDP